MGNLSLSFYIPSCAFLSRALQRLFIEKTSMLIHILSVLGLEEVQIKDQTIRKVVLCSSDLTYWPQIKISGLYYINY